MKGNCAECSRRWVCDIDPNECDEFPDPLPLTNADRIRAMSDEELARQFAHHEYLVAKEVLALFGIDIAKTEYDFEKSAADMLEQLQQPAEGE